MATARQRLLKEYKEAARAAAQPGGDAGTGVTLVPDESNLFRWRALLKGPHDTPYQGGTFELDITVPEAYPLVPPQVRCRTRLFHPNFHFKTGEICLDVLKGAWSPAWTLRSCCQAILALLADPAADSPLNCDAGNLLRAGDVRGFNSMARMYSIEYAGAPAP
jgi:peroxin-4